MLVQLEKEKTKLTALINIARPAIIPSSSKDVYANVKTEEKVNSINPSSSLNPVVTTEKADSKKTAAISEKKSEEHTSTTNLDKKPLTDQRSKRSMTGPVLPPELLKQLREEEMSKEREEESALPNSKKENQEERKEKDDGNDDSKTTGLVIRKQKKNTTKPQRNLEVLFLEQGYLKKNF